MRIRNGSPLDGEWPTRGRSRRRHGLTISWTIAIVLTAASCTETYVAELDEAIRSELEQIEGTDACGPGIIEALIPDCPVEGLCFTDVCVSHDACYLTCGADRDACDDAFRDELTTVCTSAFPRGDENYDDCRYAALTYWLAVSLLGREAFDRAQEQACMGLPPPIVDPRGACCMFGEPPVCNNDVPQAACTLGVFVAELTCEELNLVFGGCPIPANDACENRTAICDGIQSEKGLGRCAGDPTVDRGGGICSLATQDCNNGRPCLPVEGDVFRCTIPTDNRLASTDGPGLGEGCSPSDPDAMQADIWYNFVALCSGTMAIRMCAADTHDAMLAVYVDESADGSCTCPVESTTLAACNDDFCFAFGSTSGVDLSVQGGACYTIRVGGWSPDGTAVSAARGLSELDIGVFCDAAYEGDSGAKPRR